LPPVLRVRFNGRCSLSRARVGFGSENDAPLVMVSAVHLLCRVCACPAASRSSCVRFNGHPSGEVLYSFYLPSTVTAALFTINLCQPETSFDTYIWYEAPQGTAGWLHVARFPQGVCPRGLSCKSPCARMCSRTVVLR
jgi:hypothetical protein